MKITHRTTLLIFSNLIIIAYASITSAALIVGTDTLQSVTYSTYREPGENTFRIVCQTPCPIPLATLQAASDGFRVARDELVALSGLDTLAALQPVDIAYEENSICPINGNAAGYSSIYYPYGSSQPYRAKACLFHWNRHLSGQIDWFTPEQAHRLKYQTLAIHEYAHAIFYLRHRHSYEDFVRYWSYAISGNPPLPEGMCSQILVSFSAQLIYELCQRYGANDYDIRYAMQRLHDLYQSGQGYNFSGSTSLAQLRQAFDDRLNVDTSQMFLDLGYTPQQVGRTFTGVWQQGLGFKYDNGLPDGSFHITGSTPSQYELKLEAPECVWIFDPSTPRTTALTFHLVPTAHREGGNILPNVNLGHDLVVTYSYAHWNPQPGINPRHFHLYFHSPHCAGSPNWAPLPPSSVQFDYENKTVTFRPTTTGAFALILINPVIFENSFE